MLADFSTVILCLQIMALLCYAYILRHYYVVPTDYYVMLTDFGIIMLYLQVAEAQLENAMTRNDLYNPVLVNFGIDLSKVAYQDLLKPLYSALIARIWIDTNPVQVHCALFIAGQYIGCVIGF